MCRSLPQWEESEVRKSRSQSRDWQQRQEILRDSSAAGGPTAQLPSTEWAPEHRAASFQSRVSGDPAPPAPCLSCCSAGVFELAPPCPPYHQVNFSCHTSWSLSLGLTDSFMVP